MARLTNELRDLIVDRVGYFSVDVLTGWEAGLKGKERIGRRLFDRVPPDHFQGQRRRDWYAGHRGALRYRDRIEAARSVSFVGECKDGQVTISRKGWSVKRGEIVTRLERAGCYGDVMVFYWEGSKIVRTIRCGI